MPEGTNPLAVVRTNAPEEGSTFELWDLATGRSRGKIANDADLSTGLALSADGKYLAGIAKGAKAIEIWSFETGKYASHIPLEANSSPTIAFANHESLLGLLPVSDGLQVNLWPIGNTAKARTFLLPPAVNPAAGPGRHSTNGRAFGGQNVILAISPGGRYLARVCESQNLGH